ncbi:hypothetical protein V492_08413 [Pseudogymnoascus sp. VKM F-4246]|nr:hypothetical protein V492_08413 [Pseudogymnoascus sp. VKM F-4246]
MSIAPKLTTRLDSYLTVAMPRKSSAQTSNKQIPQENPSFPSLFSETFGTEIVKITAGEDESKRTFTVHKNILVSESKFFSAMFDSNFLESVTSSASFPENNPSAFEVLMEWIYYDSLKSIGLNRSHTEEEGWENMRKIITTLGLADKYCIDELADRCLTILDHRSGNYASCQLDLDMIAFIYSTTGPISMARKYAASELAKTISTTSVPNSRLRSNPSSFTALGISETCKQDRDILDDLFEAVTARPRPFGPTVGICRFHLHRKAVVCPYSEMDEAAAVYPKIGLYCGCGRSRYRIAVSASMNFGLVGNGRLYILNLTPNGIVAEQTYDTQDSLFDTAWSEAHENQVAVGCGDGSVKLFDISVPQFPVQSWQEHKREVFSVFWNLVAKDTFASSSWDGTIKIVLVTTSPSIHYHPPNPFLHLLHGIQPTLALHPLLRLLRLPPPHLRPAHPHLRRKPPRLLNPNPHTPPPRLTDPTRRLQPPTYRLPALRSPHPRLEQVPPQHHRHGGRRPHHPHIRH